MADKKSKAFWTSLAVLAVVGVFVAWRLARLSRPPSEPALPAASEKTPLPGGLVYDGPSYTVPEELNRDHKRAFEYTEYNSGPVVSGLADYYACRALSRQSPAPCKEVDSWAAKSKESPPCRERYFIALALKSAFSDEPSSEMCVKYVEEISLLDGADKRICEAVLPMLRKGDVGGLCDSLISSGLIEKEDRESCGKETLYLAGDPAACASLPDPRAKMRCESLAQLVKAFREKKPGLLKDSPFAPAYGGGEDACSAAGKQAVEVYQANAMQAFRPHAEDRAARMAAEAKVKEAELKQAQVNADEAAKLEEAKRAIAEKKIAAEAEQRALEEKRRKELEDWLAKEEARKAAGLRRAEEAKKRAAAEEQAKFEAARKADEASKRKRGVPMDDRAGGRGSKAKPKAKAKPAAEKDEADAVMISSEDNEESQ